MENRSQAANQVVLRRGLGAGYWASYASDVALLSPGTTSYEDSVTGLGYFTYTVVAKLGSLEAASTGAPAVTPNHADALDLKSTALSLPDADDADLRSQGAWAFGTRSPFGVRANTGDPWVAYFPAAPTRIASTFLRTDPAGWPHLLLIRTASQDASELVLFHDWYDGTQWKSEAMTQGKASSWTTGNDGLAFCLDKDGSPHALLDHSSATNPSGGSTDTLTYVHKVSGAWVSESLAGVDPKISNIGTYHVWVNATGQPHLLFGSWNSAVEYTKNSVGAWVGQTLPTGTISAGWYDFLEGYWTDSDNGWVFYERYGSTDPQMTYSLVALQKKGGVWLDPVVLGSRSSDGASTTAKATLSPDGTRIAVLYRCVHGLKVFHQDALGWHETLAGPDPGSYPFLRMGFDGDQLLHVLRKDTSGFLEYREQKP